MTYRIGFWTATLLVSACLDTAPSSNPSHPPEDVRPDGLATDIAGTSAGRVLRFVNVARLESLDGQVGLDRRAALGIVEHRAGPDRIDGSPDDDWFDDLEELDAVPFVGPAALAALVAYVDAHPGEPIPTPLAVHGFLENSPAARGILYVANHASFGELDEGAHVDRAAAESITAERAGPDGVSDTGDDVGFSALARLDQVPRVGATTFERLFAYAIALGHLCPAPSVHGISECSGEAASILEVVNTADFETLDDDVGLDERAAAAIVAHRIGDDALPWTSDDQPFTSLAELDAVPYVDHVAFSALLAYVSPW